MKNYFKLVSDKTSKNSGCANYEAVGPFGKKHYCLATKDIDEYECKIHQGKYCQYYEEAVLPLNKDFIGPWKNSLDPTFVPVEKSKKTNQFDGYWLVCECGKEFRVSLTSRAKKCPNCIKKLAREKASAKRRVKGITS